jgi:hypothetical protein
MSNKSSKTKTGTKNEKPDQRSRQLRWARIAFAVFGLLLILSMVLSLVSKSL